MVYASINQQAVTVSNSDVQYDTLGCGLETENREKNDEILC
jgi:hypothetical protein